MNVSELIRALSSLDPEAVVLVEVKPGGEELWSPALRTEQVTPRNDDGDVSLALVVYPSPLPRAKAHAPKVKS